MTELPISPRDVVALFLREVAADPDAGRFGPLMPALLGVRGEGVCDCDWAESPPTDWVAPHGPLLHHCECTAEKIAVVLGRVYGIEAGR